MAPLPPPDTPGAAPRSHALAPIAGRLAGARAPGQAALPPPEQAALLDVAEDAILAGLEGRRLTPPEWPTERRGVFVTLHVDGELNGCIGTIEPDEPLAAAVARRAWDAAFADPRLPRLRTDDWDRLHIEISVLSPLERLDVRSFDELLAAITPGVDGLMITAGSRRGTFLPSVWEQLPDPRQFLDQLWRKAGLTPGTWPEGLVVERYRTQSFGRTPLKSTGRSSSSR